PGLPGGGRPGIPRPGAGPGPGRVLGPAPAPGLRGENQRLAAFVPGRFPAPPAPVRAGRRGSGEPAPAAALSPARPDGTLPVDGCRGPPGPRPDRPVIGDRQARLRDDLTDRQARPEGRRPAPPGSGLVRLAGQDPDADAAQDRPAAETAGARRRR